MNIFKYFDKKPANFAATPKNGVLKRCFSNSNELVGYTSGILLVLLIVFFFFKKSSTGAEGDSIKENDLVEKMDPDTVVPEMDPDTVVAFKGSNTLLNEVENLEFYFNKIWVNTSETLKEWAIGYFNLLKECHPNIWKYIVEINNFIWIKCSDQGLLYIIDILSIDPCMLSSAFTVIYNFIHLNGINSVKLLIETLPLINNVVEACLTLFSLNFLEIII